MSPLQHRVGANFWRGLCKGRAAAALALAGMAGCSSCPPFRASWYLIQPSPAPASAPSSSAPTIYLALLHEGDREARLTQVTVNPTAPVQTLWQRMQDFSGERTPQMLILEPGTGSGPRRAAQPERAKPGEGWVWKPGQLLLFEVMDKDHLGGPEAACSVPVAVQIECDARCRKTQAVSGSLPNYLRDDWIEHCQPLKPPAPSAAQQGTR